MTWNNVFAMGILAAIGLFFVTQSFVFLKDLWFYRSMSWDLLLDSRNKLFFLEMIRNSRSFKDCPIGHVRLTIGYQQLFMTLILLGVVLFYQLRSSVSYSKEVRLAKSAAEAASDGLSLGGPLVSSGVITVHGSISAEVNLGFGALGLYGGNSVTVHLMAAAGWPAVFR